MNSLGGLLVLVGLTCELELHWKFLESRGFLHWQNTDLVATSNYLQ